jgi:hypothetical protein
VRRHTWLILLLTGLLLLLPYARLEDLPRAVVYGLFGLIAVGGVLAGLRLHRLERPLPWLLLAAGQALMVAGDALWDLHERVLHVAPRPSPADLLYLAGSPAMAACFAILARRRAPGGHGGDLIDAAVVAVSASLVAWVFVLAPVAATDATSAERLVAAAYPAADLLLLGLAMRLLLGAGRRPRAFWLLGAGLVLLTAADLASAVQALHGGDAVPAVVQELGGLGSYLLLAAAVLDPTVALLDARVAGPAPPLTARRLALLAAASLVAPAVLAARALQGETSQALAIALGAAAPFPSSSCPSPG